MNAERLPTAGEARKIARETGRFVAARDGHIYSGATKKEGDAYRQKRDEAFRILEAIDTLAKAPDPSAWLEGSERHWFVDFDRTALAKVTAWAQALDRALP